MNLSQQELQILVTILSQVKLSYKEYEVVVPLVQKLESFIVKPQPQDVPIQVSEEKEEPSQPQS